SGDGPFTIPLANFQMDGNAGKLVVDGADLTLNNFTNSTANYSGSDILIDNAGSLKFAHTGSADQIWLSNQTNITFGASGGGTFNTGNSSESGLNFVNNSTTKFITTGGAANYISGTNGFNLHGQNITFDVAKGTAADGNDLIVSARLWNNHGIIKDGAGTMVLTATNSNFRGNVTINAGKVIASTNSSLGAVQNGKSVFVNDGAELSIGAQDVFANAHSNNAVQFVVDGGKISNAGAVYNYLQNTTFKDGAELHAVDGNAVWKAFKLHNVNVLRNDDGSAAAPVRFTSAPNSPNAVIGFGDITGNIANGTSTLNIQDITSANASVSDDLPDLIISGIVADPTINTNTKETRPTAVKKTGNGMLELTAANTFTGQVTVSEGVLRLSGDALAVKAPIALEANGTLDLNAAEGTEKAFSGRVTGTGRTVKSGTGTLTLNTANGFEASSLNVSAGRANIVGTLSGDLAIADGASFSPGDGIGTLAVNGDFTVGDGAQLVFEFGEDASDLLVIGSEGTLDISEDAVLELLFSDADPSKTYTLIEAEGGLGEYADAEFWTDLLTTAADTNWQLQVVGNTLQAVFGASDSVPEPATWALLVLGAAGLFIVRKKRV
ncbi:MAG: autotransporter-associated beta strand repeat-containing protein, partial [Thermoguttaceae bacterium]|nr:autotransporter-associated beta strand repeat-containing protein [Thermoguttaceae bacterium]